MWQDIVMAFGNILLTIGLVQMVGNRYGWIKTQMGFRTGAILTTWGLFIMAVTMISLELFITGYLTVFSSVMWFLLVLKPYQ